MDFTTAAPQHFNGQDKFGATFCGCCASPCFFRWWPELTVKQREWEKPPPSFKGAHTRSGLFCLRWPEKSHKTVECEVGHCDRLDVHVICLYITHLWIFKSHFQQLINEFLIVFIHFILLQQLTRAQEKRPLTGDLCFFVRSLQWILMVSPLTPRNLPNP